MNGIDYVLDTNVIVGYLGATLVTCDAQVAALRASGLPIETPQRSAT